MLVPQAVSEELKQADRQTDRIALLYIRCYISMNTTFKPVDFQAFGLIDFVFMFIVLVNKT